MEDNDEIVPMRLGRDGQKLEQQNDKTALVDADTLVFTSCLSCEYFSEILGEKFHTKEEYEALTNDEQYVSDEAGEGIYELDVEKAKLQIQERVQELLDFTGCRKHELHFTYGGKVNFRYYVEKPEGGLNPDKEVMKLVENGKAEPTSKYKATRTGRPPAGLKEMKEWCVKEFGGINHTKFEADDIVVYLKKQNPNKYILCAVDKDVLNAVAGKHMNYYKSAKYDIKVKWHEVTVEEARKWRYIQCLTGDSTDNIEGLHRVGPVGAKKALATCKTSEDMWDAVVAMYESKGKTILDAILTMRLVDMHQIYKVDDEYKLQLFTPIK